MPKTMSISQRKYEKLLKELRAILEKGRARALQAASSEAARTYWELGEKVLAHGFRTGEMTDRTTLEDLAQGLGVAKSTLWESVTFCQTYPKGVPETPLSWTHFRKLIYVKENAKRQWYEKAAVREGWNRDQLGRAIQEDFYSGQSAAPKRKAKASRLKRPTDPMYLYKAIVDRVIDGDSLLIRIDLGFTVWKEQRVRLAGIDCPEMGTPEGQKAFEWVEKKMAHCKFVLVKTNKIDIYGRYVGHVFYSTVATDKEKIFASGQYLNQEILDHKLATTI